MSEPRIKTSDFLTNPSQELKGVIEALPEDARKALLGEYVEISRKAQLAAGISRDPLPMFRAWATQPELFAIKVILDHYITRKGLVDTKLKCMIAVLISEKLACKACINFHSSSAKEMGVEERTIEKIKRFEDNKGDWPPRERAAMEYAIKVNFDHNRMVGKDTESLRVVGFSDPQIMELTLAALTYAEYNRFNSALGI
ncbi:MAG: carboxymuconolactone decarboxylase family protein [Nitrososphaerales archaeon]